MNSVIFKTKIMYRLFINNTNFTTLNRLLCTTKHMKAVDKIIVESLERLALVDFPTEAGITRLEKSIQFAENLIEVDTSSVEPLIGTVYDVNENIRNDIAVKDSNREELMKIAPVSEEFYYVAPLGTFSRKQHKS